jgi:hypothetical protein
MGPINMSPKPDRRSGLEYAYAGQLDFIECHRMSSSGRLANTRRPARHQGRFGSERVAGNGRVPVT